MDELTHMARRQARAARNDINQGVVEAVEPRGYYRIKVPGGRVISGVKGGSGLQVGRAVMMASSGSGRARRWNVLADGYTRNQTIEEVIV
jgi:hypothetical protein